MATPLELLSKQNAALRQALAANENTFNHAAKTIMGLRKELEEANQSLRSLRDLLFGILHSVGPNISIRIDDFDEIMKEASFCGDIEMKDGNFIADIKFILETLTPTEIETDGK